MIDYQLTSSFFVLFSPWIFCSLNTHHFVFPGFTQFRESLPSLFVLCPRKFLKTVNWVHCKAQLLFVSSLRHNSPFLPNVQFLKNHYFMHFDCCCFRWRGKFSLILHLGWKWNRLSEEENQIEWNNLEITYYSWFFHFLCKLIIFFFFSGVQLSNLKKNGGNTTCLGWVVWGLTKVVIVIQHNAPKGLLPLSLWHIGQLLCGAMPMKNSPLHQCPGLDRTP